MKRSNIILYFVEYLRVDPLLASNVLFTEHNL